MMDVMAAATALIEFCIGLEKVIFRKTKEYAIRYCLSIAAGGA